MTTIKHRGRFSVFCPEGRLFSSSVCITFGRAKRFQAFRKYFFLRPWPRTRRSPFPSGGRRRPPSHARRLSDEGERTVSASPLIRRSPSSPASRELPPLGEEQTRGNVGLRRRGGACPAPFSPMAAPRGIPSVSSQTRCHLPLQGRQGAPPRAAQCAPEALFRASGDGNWFSFYSRGSRLQ